MDKLKGKVAIITGASSGIGRATAYEACKERKDLRQAHIVRSAESPRSEP